MKTHIITTTIPTINTITAITTPPPPPSPPKVHHLTKTKIVQTVQTRFHAVRENEAHRLTGDVHLFSGLTRHDDVMMAS